MDQREVENIRSDCIYDQIKQSIADDTKKSGEKNSSLRKCPEGRQEIRRQGGERFGG